MALFSLSSKTHLAASPVRSFPRLLAVRAQSNTPTPNLYNVDLSSDDSSSSSSSTTDPLLRKLEDAIHRIIVRRSAPDWLPFVPGSSYWVPPPRSTAGSLGIAQLVEKLANPLTDEESLSMTTVRGWPSSDFYLNKGELSPSMEVKTTSIKVKAGTEATSSNNLSKSEDEEG